VLPLYPRLFCSSNFSANSDVLPDFSSYFEPFAQLQYDAFQAVAALQTDSLLEGYVLLLREQDVREIQVLFLAAFSSVLQDTIAPQMQIARNMGFAADWRYTAS
jgi:hypothetical protein